MKKIHKIIGVLILTFGISGCDEDFLDKTPYTEKVTTNFYKTPEEAFEGLVAVYDMLQRTGFGHFILTSELASDNCFGGGGKSDDFSMQYWDRFETGQDLNIALWQNNYKGIYRANLLLEKLPDVDWGNNPDLELRYEAEARFLRAHFYFELVRVFENIPLVTKPLESEEFIQEQAAPAEVYTQIAEDFKFAVENLPEVPYPNQSSAEYGRVTVWAAKAYLSKVFLFYTDYYEQPMIGDVITKSEVLQHLDDVINQSGHDLVSDYASLWRASSVQPDSTLDYAGENNEEIVWSVKYTHKGLRDWSLNDGNRWIVMIGLRTSRVFPYGSGWGFGPVEPDYWNAFAPEDTIRRNATIISADYEGITFNVSDWRQATNYAWKKYNPVTLNGTQNSSEEIGGDFQIDNFEDYIVIRYADVLLMAAELNLGENQALAQQYFDQVRSRAIPSYVAGSITVSKDAIIDERRFEFGLEGHRYWDLIRQDMNTAKAALDHSNGDPEFDVSFRSETGGFLAIPESQITISAGAFEQNQGW